MTSHEIRNPNQPKESQSAVRRVSGCGREQLAGGAQAGGAVNLLKLLTIAGVPPHLHPEAVEAIADQAGITLPAGTIAALFAAIDVTEQEPFTAMSRLGVQIVQVSE